MLTRKPTKSREPLRRSLLERAESLIDSTIEFVSPTWANRRFAEKAKRKFFERQIDRAERRIESLSGGTTWSGASQSDQRSYRYLGTRLGPDTAASIDLAELQANCLELYRNNPLIHSAVETRVANEVGSGLTAQPRVREKDGFSKDQTRQINDKLQDICERWSRSGVDKSRRFSLSTIQKMAMRNFAIYGEVFILLSYSPYTGPIGLSIDIIAPERVETPPEFADDVNVRLGVRYNSSGVIQGYYVRTTRPDESLGEWEYEHEYVPRFDVTGQPRMVHVFDPVLDGQSRGVPWCESVINRAKDKEDFFEAELINKNVENAFGLFIKQGSRSSSPHEMATANGGVDRIEEWIPGNVQYGNAEDEVTVVDPTRPGGNFVPFIEATDRSVAAGLQLPFEQLTKNYERVTFASGRLGLLDGKQSYKSRLQTFVDQFLVPLWCRVVNDAVYSGELDGLVDILDYAANPQIYERVLWTTRGAGWMVNPKDEANAKVTLREAKLETLADSYAENGRDWEDGLEQDHAEKLRQVELDVALRVFKRDLEQQNGLEPEATEQPGEQPANEPADEPTEEPAGTQ